MKTFFNVLYRRILYKIPLKFLLLLVAVFSILFACYSSASYTNLGGGPASISPGQTFEFGRGSSNYRNDTFCIININSCNYTLTNPNNNESVVINEYHMVGCLTGVQLSSTQGLLIKNNSSSECNIALMSVDSENRRPDYTSLQCQTEYNLIPISSVDSNYCQTNNLCPSCPVCPSVPVGTGGYSQLYINNILHLGAPNIIMNIPDEIDWDYAYTQGGQNMNIDVVGYNVDYEKIDSIVQFQNYKPSSDDFQRIIGLLAPYTKIIVFFVFLFIVWAWIKKPFKSKKL